MREILLKLCRRENLTREETAEAFSQIAGGNATDAQIGGLLIGLAAKGTTVEELVGAASVMREKIVPIPCESASVILDTCGTGGDVRGTFNISTAAAIIAAAAGVKVVKHGNRSATSKSGSADVLEKLGVRIDVDAEIIQTCLREANICFAYARNHHPAMKLVAEARSSLGVPTIFNMLAPLMNPGRAKHQLLGVFAPELTDRFAEVLRELGSQRAWVVHADDGLDEISTLGPTRISELRDGHIKSSSLDPKSLGLPNARLSDLQTENVEQSAEALRLILAGEKGSRRDIALLNAAAALVVAGVCNDLPHGLMTAAEVVDEGVAQKTLETLVRCTNSAG